MCTRHLHSLTEAQSSLIRSMFISALHEAPLVISLSLFILRERILRLITCQCSCIHSSGLTRSSNDQHVVCPMQVQSLSSIDQTILICSQNITSRSRQSRQLPIATVWLHTVVGTTACNRNYRLLHTVVEGSLSVQNLVQTTVWPTTDDQLKVA